MRFYYAHLQSNDDDFYIIYEYRDNDTYGRDIAYNSLYDFFDFGRASISHYMGKPVVVGSRDNNIVFKV
jgi:hypothetical protein